MKIRRTDIERILILCAAALVVVLAIRGGNQQNSEAIYLEGDLSYVETGAAPTAETVSAVVFYQDGDGYLVPVTRQVEKTDGIAAATLSLMVKSSRNDMAAARMGLRTVVPEGTKFELDIRDGKARVDLSREALACASAEEEALMVDAVAGALTCFSTVEEVTMLFDGQKRSKLPYGTDVSGVFTGDAVNLEAVETASLESADLLTLYFPSRTGRLLVPVTRAVFSDADITTAIVELLKGPRSDSGLERPLPEDCGVRSVQMKDGVVTIDFSRQFLDAMSGDGARQALRAITFTCSRFPGVRKVNLQVEGEAYKPQEDAAATFINAEAEVLAQYPGVVEID